MVCSFTHWKCFLFLLGAISLARPLFLNPLWDIAFETLISYHIVVSVLLISCKSDASTRYARIALFMIQQAGSSTETDGFGHCKK